MKRRLGQQPIEADVGLLRVLLGKCGLAQPGGWLPFAVYEEVPYGVTTDAQELYSVTLGRAITVRTWHQGVYVASTNDDSNYWTFDLQEADGTSIETLDTSGISASTFEVLSETGIDASVAASAEGLKIVATKTGSPGGLYLYGPAVFVT